MSDTDIKKLFDDAFLSCQVQHADVFTAMVHTRRRYSSLIGTYEHLIKALVRDEADLRIVRDVMQGLAHDVLSKGE